MVKTIFKTNRHAESLVASWKEGIAAIVMLTITDYYLIPMGLFLGATTQQIGFVDAIPSLLAAGAQVFSTHLVRVLKSRRDILTRGALVQGFLLLGIAALPYISIQGRIIFFIGLVELFRIANNIIGTVWGSLMSDYLRPEERGKYLGWRSKMTAISGVLSLVVSGGILFFFKPVSAKLGFSILFILAAVARLTSCYLMHRMEDVPVIRKQDSDFTFFQFLARFRESNFVKFVFYVSLTTFATQVSSPYFSVYMLKELHVDYLTYTMLHLATVVGSIMAFPIWGKHADMVGNAQVLRVTGMIVPLFPLFWLFTRSLPLLYCFEFIAGFVWAGFNLCSVNFIYDAASPEKRVRCIAYFNLINGIAIFIGASLGGYLATVLPPLWGSRFYTLFCVSSCLRFIPQLLLNRSFREVRATPHSMPSKELFLSVLGFRSFLGRAKNFLFYVK